MYEVPKVLESHPKLLAGDVVGAFKETFLTVDQRLAMQPNIEVHHPHKTHIRPQPTHVDPLTRPISSPRVSSLVVWPSLTVPLSCACLR